MTVLRKILILFFLLAGPTAFGQFIGYSPIDESKVSKWNPKLLSEYYGTYHFGDSEGESTLILFHSGAETICQIKSTKWAQDSQEFLWYYKNLTGVRISDSGQFYSDQFQGEFVSYQDGDEQRKCLKVSNPWTAGIEAGKYELGFKMTSDVNGMYSGRYSYASTRELIPEDLSNLSLDELKIMRNEVFARYGYKFQEGGEMAHYFWTQRWYQPQHSDVNQFVTSVEKRNIELILTAEKKN